MTVKRLFDLFSCALGLVFLAPVFLLVALAIRLDSPGPVFFRQERVGRFGRPFRIFKFRTMVADAERRGAQVSRGDDPRITRIGQFLRRYKLDELPQLLNVVRGEMSLVGPRPEVPRYVAAYPEAYARILQVRPGITDFAALEFRNENELLSGVENPEKKYLEDILPRKIEYYYSYISRQSMATDLRLIFRTLGAILFRRR